MDPFYQAISFYRRKRFDDCITICNGLLQAHPEQKGPWELKMRAMTQRVYVDDIEADDGLAGNFDEPYVNERKWREKRVHKRRRRMTTDHDANNNKKELKITNTRVCDATTCAVCAVCLDEASKMSDKKETNKSCFSNIKKKSERILLC